MWSPARSINARICGRPRRAAPTSHVFFCTKDRDFFHHGVSMSLRLATANENHWGGGGHDFSRAAAETHLQEALAAEGYPSALGYASAPQGLKPHLNTLRNGTTEVVPSRTRKAHFHRRARRRTARGIATTNKTFATALRT